jgi:hypothetical protein
VGGRRTYGSLTYNNITLSRTKHEIARYSVYSREFIVILAISHAFSMQQLKMLLNNDSSQYFISIILFIA